MPPAIRIENIGKRYQLGVTHAGSVRELVNGTARRLFRRGRPNQVAANGSLLQEPERVDDEGSFWALKDVSFEVQPGEVVGIIGKNGAGKSTLLKILSRITLPTTGQIELYGRVASLLEVGTGFHPELTGRENVFLNGAILGMTRGEIRRRFDAIIDFAGIEKFIDTPVKRYSSGMYVRLAFAVAAHLEPEILVVDEVLAVGDAEFQAKCLGKMKDVAHAGRTVLFVSHNMAAVQQLTSRAVVLAKGEMCFDGETSGAIAEYTARAPNRREWTAEGRAIDGEYDRRVEFLSVAVPSDVSSFRAEEPVRVWCRLKSNGYAGPVRISVSLFTSSRAVVGSGFSDATMEIGAHETTAVELRISDHRLAPGVYGAALSVGRGDDHSSVVDFDSISESVSFEVLPQRTSSGAIAKWESGWGVIRLDDVQLERLGNARDWAARATRFRSEPHRPTGQAKADDSQHND